MIFHRVLNHIFSSYSSISVLRALQFTKEGLTGRGISRNSGLSPRSAMIALSKLENFKIVKRVIGGKDHIFTLNKNNYLVEKVILPLLETENQFLPEILSLIKKYLEKRTISIFIFGSVARKEENISSDLDVCIVIQDNSAKKEISKIISQLFEIISNKYGATLSVITLTKKEFIKRAIKNLSPVNNIILEGILISGKSIKLLLYGTKK